MTTEIPISSEDMQKLLQHLEGRLAFDPVSEEGENLHTYLTHALKALKQLWDIVEPEAQNHFWCVRCARWAHQDDGDYNEDNKEECTDCLAERLGRDWEQVLHERWRESSVSGDESTDEA